MDPQSSKRTISKDSIRVLQMFQQWLKFQSPSLSMNPKPQWSREAAADACADNDKCQIGGFLRFSNGDIRWFSEEWHFSDFHALDIPVSTETQKDISCYETLAQIALLHTLCHLLPAQRFALTLRSQSDNTAANPLQIPCLLQNPPFVSL
jgi:hypothetical protein